jgi:glycine/D-amino acid oxidase-like deaminating enzyme
MATVILGTGIIGTSIAYYLSQTQSPSTIHLVEPSPTLFSSASGYAGGFLAKDWFSPSATALGALSFDEHKRLADEHGGHKKWGYLHTTTWSYTAANAKGKDENTKRGDYWLRQGTSRANAAVQRPSGSVNEQTPMWLSRAEGDDAEVISEQDSTAQV